MFTSLSTISIVDFEQVNVGSVIFLSLFVAPSNDLVHKTNKYRKLRKEQISVKDYGKLVIPKLFSGAYFPVFGLKIRENTDQKKLRIWTLFTQCYRHSF